MSLIDILKLACKYLFPKSSTQAIHILSIITMIAMAVGSAALIVILSTFNGFEQISSNLNESFQPDLTVTPQKNKQFDISEEEYHQIVRNENIVAVSKILEEKVYLRYLGSETLAQLKGVDQKYFRTNTLKDHIIIGDTILENEKYSFGMLGMGIANKLNADPSNQFEQIQVFYPKSEFSGGLSENFEQSYLTPTSIFSLYQDYDDKYVLAPLSFVQYLNNSDDTRISSLEIKIKSGTESEVRKILNTVLNTPIIVRNKMELNESFYRISRIEKFVVTLILTFILIILSFNFIGSLTMHLIEKTKDMRILGYLGMNQKNIQTLYLFIGLLKGSIGGIIGLILGLGIIAIQKTFGIVPMPGSGTFVIQSYPVTVYFKDICLVLAIIFFVSLFASIFPARKAKNIV